MTNQMTYSEARDALVGEIDGKRLPLMEFLDAQQDEIERLNAYIKKWAEDAADTDRKFQALEQENARLRAALSELVEAIDYRSQVYSYEPEFDKAKAALDGAVEPSESHRGDDIDPKLAQMAWYHIGQQAVINPSQPVEKAVQDVYRRCATEGWTNVLHVSRS